jgi:transglutaminase-like putative cysteine protease
MSATEAPPATGRSHLPGANPPGNRPFSRGLAYSQEPRPGARPAHGTLPGTPAASQPREARASALVRAVLCAGLAATGGATFHRVFPVASLVPVIAVAAGVPAALSWLLSSVRRVPLVVSFAASVVAWLLVISATMFRSVAAGGVLPGGAVLRHAWLGLTGGWRQVLDSILPAAADPQLLVSVSALVWLASWLAVESTLRGRSALLPCLAPAVVFGAGLLAGVTGPGSNLAEAGVFVALAGLLLLSGSAPPAAGGAARRYAAGVVVVLVCVAVAVEVGPRLPYAHARAPFNVRTLITPPQQPYTAVNPLDEVGAWAVSPRLDLFDVRMSQPEDLRLAVLDRFDGLEWSSDAHYVPTTSRIPGTGATGVPQVTVTQSVTLSGLSTIWLPAANRPVSFAGPGVLVDPADGQLIASHGTRSGMTYTVVSAVLRYTTAQLRSAVPADDAAAKAALILPPHAPQVIAQTALAGTAGAAFPYQQAVRLAAFLQAEEKYAPAAAPGHTYGHIAYFLSTSHEGTSEQFATAFALMARTLGLPSRVVVGFQPGPAQPDGTYQITGADVLVWPEIDFRGLGWVPFYPTPTAGHATGAGLLGAGESGQRQRIDKSLAAAPLPSPVPPPHAAHAAPRARTSSARGAVSAQWVLVAGLVPLALVIYLLLAALLPARRRARRRRAGTAAAEVAGAWRETTSRLRVLGLRRVDTSTTFEVADFGGGRLDSDAAARLQRLAAVADWSEFAGTQPGPAAAAEAWQHHDAVRSRVRAAVPLAARIRHGLHPANVLGRWRD